VAALYKARITRKVFYSEESGFGVFKASVKGRREAATLVGILVDVNEGDFLEITGDEVVHPRFGDQIKVIGYKAILPEDKEGIVNYLSSGRIKGIGKKSAEKIVNAFGTDTFDILEHHPERLSEIKGIKKDIREEIKKSFQDNHRIRDLTVKLSPYGIGPETTFKIFKEFGEASLEILQVNPFILIDRIRGIGFRIADTIARAFGLERDDPHRIRAGTLFLLEQVEQRNGDMYMEETDLAERSATLLDVDPKAVLETIEHLVERNDLVREIIPEKVVMSYRNYAIEKSIAQKLSFLSREESGLPEVVVDFADIFAKISLELSDDQKGAVFSAVRNPITIITGGPGTGKTTIIRAIIECLKAAGQSVSIAAPTGRAAKRVEEASAYKASTIHRLLKVDPQTRSFLHNEGNPLPVNAVIVDEFSMVDSFLFHALLKAISRHTRLIIIGDKDQLPSVGPGNVLRDLIHSDYFHTIFLKRNFRQDENSLIIDNAYRINTGENLALKPYSRELDFVFIKVAGDEEAREKVCRIIDYYKHDFLFNSPDYQVLVPMYRGQSGIDQLNQVIQARFNPAPLITLKEKVAFKRGDKVMQLKNNYEKVIFNGEQGVVAAFDPQGNILHIDFDGYIVEYSPDELDELTLSYAVSVHKSQGSEYGMVILVLLPGHAIMLNRELFYTAVTRAKKRLFLVSDIATIQRAIANSAPAERKTLLHRRLQEAFTSS